MRKERRHYLRDELAHWESNLCSRGALGMMQAAPFSGIRCGCLKFDWRVFMRRVASLFCLLSAGFLASCSSFDTKWDATKPLPSANPSALLNGKWEGTWQSDATDYHGHMQAMIFYKADTVIDKQTAQEYAADIRLRFYEIGIDEYAVTLNATRMPDGKIHFEGKKDLGYFKGGIIKFDGYVYNDDSFFCDYISEKDCGTFKMRRIVGENQ